MALHRGEWVKNQAVETDGEVFDRCTFIDCKLVYRGGELPDISACEFGGCSWVLMDAAIRTLAFMRFLKAAGGGDFVDSWIAIIRGGADLPDAPSEQVQ